MSEHPRSQWRLVSELMPNFGGGHLGAVPVGSVFWLGSQPAARERIAATALSREHGMPVEHFSGSDARNPGVGLLAALLRRRDVAWSATCKCHLLERRAIDAHRATIDPPGAR